MNHDGQKLVQEENMVQELWKARNPASVFSFLHLIQKSICVLYFNKAVVGLSIF